METSNSSSSSGSGDDVLEIEEPAHGPKSKKLGKSMKGLSQNLDIHAVKKQMEVDRDEIRDAVKVAQDKKVGAEVGLSDFKNLVYGGLIFYVILSFPQFSSYGDCKFVSYNFTCYVEDSLPSGDTNRYSYIEALQPNADRVVGLYTVFPPQCGSPAFYLNETIPPDRWPKKGTIPVCEYPIIDLEHGAENSTKFANWTQDLYAYDSSGLVLDTGTVICSIKPYAASLALASVVTLVVGFILDQWFSQFSEEYKKASISASTGRRKSQGIKSSFEYTLEQSSFSL